MVDHIHSQHFQLGLLSVKGYIRYFWLMLGDYMPNKEELFESVYGLIVSTEKERTARHNCISRTSDIKLGDRIAGYIGGNNIWRIAQKRKKIAIARYKFGGYGTIATPSPGIGAILADLILAV